MNLRHLWRSVNRLIGFLRVPDSPVVRPSGRLVLLSCNDVDRGMSVDGLRFSPLLEGIREIVEELGYTAVNLSHPYAVFLGNQVKDGTLTLNHRALLARISTLWLRLLGSGRATVARVEREAPLYRDLLQALKPEAIFAIQPPWAMCRAARESGITVIEAMHGSNISLNDHIFGRHMAQPDDMLPNYVLGFDDVTFATYTKLCEGRDIVALRASDPWLHACRRRQASERPDGGRQGPSFGGKRVLVTLQWGYDGERASLSGIIPNGILHPAIEAAMAATVGSEVSFLVRLHPIQLTSPGYRHHRRYIESLASRYPHVETERASSEPLPLLLEEVCGHLTMSSSAVGEAAAANVPSLMLCPTLQPGGAHDGFFAELAAAGRVTFGTLEEGAIVEWIAGCKGPADREQPPQYTESVHRTELRFYASLIEGSRAASPTRSRETGALKPMSFQG